MSYTVDANILLYASDESSAFSTPARRLVDRLIEGPDAHLVALMRQYGVDTICSEDREFHKFTGIRVQPLR